MTKPKKRKPRRTPMRLEPRRNPGPRRSRPHRESRGKSRAPWHPPHKGRNGGLLQTGGTNPGAGRPSNEFRLAMAALAEHAAKGAYVRRCLSGKEGYKAFFSALEYCSLRAWGKPEQPVGGQDAEPTEGQITLQFVDARLADHPAWPGLKSPLAAASTSYPKVAQAVAGVLVNEESAPESECRELTP